MSVRTVRGPNSLTDSQKRLLRREAQHRHYLKTREKKRQDNAARYQRAKRALTLLAEVERSISATR